MPWVRPARASGQTYVRRSRHELSTMTYEELLQFIEQDMRMSHVYQPVMLMELLKGGGRASVTDIARALLNEDRSQLEYYAEIAKNMVGKVLRSRNIVARDESAFELIGFSDLSPAQVSSLQEACSRKLAEYIARRGDAIGSIGGVAGITSAEHLGMKYSRLPSFAASYAASRRTSARLRLIIFFREVVTGRTRSRIFRRSVIRATR